MAVGSRAGAVLRRRGLSVSPRFLWECLTSRTVSPFPARPWPHRSPLADHPVPVGSPACRGTRDGRGALARSRGAVLQRR